MIDYNDDTYTSADSSRINSASTRVTTPGLTVAFPQPTPSSLTPVEEQNIQEFVEKEPKTFTKPLTEVEGMVGKSGKVYAASDSTAVSLEKFRVNSAGTPDSANMADPPAPNEIGLSNLTPRQDDRQDQSDTLNRTLHQVSHRHVSNALRILTRSLVQATLSVL